MSILFFIVAMDCPLFNVINGKTLGMNTQKGSSVQVKCNVGFKLNNENYQFRTCLNTGHWSGPGGNMAKVECLSRFLQIIVFFSRHKCLVVWA